MIKKGHPLQISGKTNYKTKSVFFALRNNVRDSSSHWMIHYYDATDKFIFHIQINEYSVTRVMGPARAA